MLYWANYLGARAMYIENFCWIVVISLGVFVVFLVCFVLKMRVFKLIALFIPQGEKVYYDRVWLALEIFSFRPDELGKRFSHE